MISAYVGLPGSGKSYSAVANIIKPAVEQGVPVYTNVPHVGDYWDDNDGLVKPFQSEALNDPQFYNNFEPGSVVVIDECWRVWASGQKANQIPEFQKSFLAEHRHLVGDHGKSTEIYLVTQDLSQCSAFMRALIDKTFRHTKLNAVGQKNRFRVDIYEGAVTGQNPPKRLLINQEFYKYDAAVFDLYKSHTLSDQAGNDDSIDKRSTVFRRWGIKYGLPFGIAIMLWGIWSVFDLYSSYAEPKKPSQQPVKTQVVQHGQVQKVSMQRRYFDDVEFSIVYNNQTRFDVEYIIRMHRPGGVADLTLKELHRMGIKVKPINQCLVELQVNDEYRLALCELNEDRQGSFGSQAVRDGLESVL